MSKIVLWRPMYEQSGADRLRELGAEVVVVDSSEESEIVAAASDADALWVRYPENSPGACSKRRPG
ncbi:hypothetical protein [Amycolatopsis sp. La24]|uniref:hypothetical protein n=1 Tax=Amycolatopsis sp. La24 TaxID=3028304 RepID=UPI0023B0E1E0|nr:hypothetical protein [Amycolatopsis sp. La24]